MKHIIILVLVFLAITAFTYTFFTLACSVVVGVAGVRFLAKQADEYEAQKIEREFQNKATDNDYI